jgi:flagellar protein FliO/FliZ
LEKIRKAKRRSQLTVIIIVLAALIGVLAINTDRVTADKGTVTTATVKTDAMTPATDSANLYSSAAPSLFKLISALVLVVASIYGGIYLLKRMMGKKYSGNRTNSLLEVVETTYVAPKKSVSLLRVGDKAVLVGMTDSNMNMLTELTPEETSRALAAIESEPQPENFGRTLKAAMGKLRLMSAKRADSTALET